jgi:hypothetical protein
MTDDQQVHACILAHLTGRGVRAKPRGMKQIAISLIFVVAACGGAEKKPTTPEGGDGEDPHAKLTPELHTFHETLAPRWHAEAGEQRMKDTCGALADFQAQAASVKAAPAKEGVDPAAWTEASTALEASVTGLAGACGGADVAAFDQAFHAVHEAFHRAMELVVGKHSHEDAHKHDEAHKHDH